MAENNTFDKLPWTNIAMLGVIATTIGSVIYLRLAWPSDAMGWIICFLIWVLSVSVMITVQQSEWSGRLSRANTSRTPWILRGVCSIAVALGLLAIAYLHLREHHHLSAAAFMVAAMFSVLTGYLWMRGRRVEYK
jgi:hypothetical protein